MESTCVRRGSFRYTKGMTAILRPLCHHLLLAIACCHEAIAAMPQAPADPPATMDSLAEKPLYEFTEAEIDVYLKHLHAAEPDLRKRILHLARKNIGQPYELYLLGEMPFEPYDPQPLYCLGKSDCLAFTEHTYAMALTRDWPAFMAMLQRIRYRDGQIGVATRNHYTEADWNPSNRWLVRDVTAEIAGDKAVGFDEKIDRSAFLKKRYGLEIEIPVEMHHDVYLPFDEIARAKDHLEGGDFINVVRGIVKPGAPPDATFGGNAFVGHVGFVAFGENGVLNMIHSAEPAVREESLDAYIARSTADLAAKDEAGKPRLVGFKFLRLEADPLANLHEIDGDEVPRVTLPKGGRAKL